jgi:hypothetical protein
MATRATALQPERFNMVRQGERGSVHPRRPKWWWTGFQFPCVLGEWVQK